MSAGSKEILQSAGSEKERTNFVENAVFSMLFRFLGTFGSDYYIIAMRTDD